MNENMMTVKTAIVAFFTALGAFLGWKGVMLMSWAAVMILDYTRSCCIPLFTSCRSKFRHLHFSEACVSLILAF